MTTHMKSQIMSVITTVQTMKLNAKLTAFSYDGTIDKEEARILNQLEKACDKFVKELQKIK